MIVPKLRFAEFQSKEWDEKSIDELCEILNSRRKPVSEINRKKGVYPYYGASGIVDYVDEFIFDERLVLVGEDGAKWGAFEKTAFIAEGKYWVNNHAHVLKAIGINDTLLENYLVMLDITKYITGAAPPKLTLGKLKEIIVPFPINKTEQQKIASCLSSLDDLITAHNQKLDALKAHKKGLMQQLFPAEGEKVPKLRFEEFKDSGEWELLPIGPRVEVISGYPFAGEEITEDKNGIPLIRGINITEGFIRHSSDIDRYFVGDVAGLKRFIVKTGDLVIGMDGSKVGKNSALITETDSGGLLVQRIARLRSEKEGLILYVFHQINSTKFHSYVDRINTSGGIPHISLKQIEDFEIFFPPKPAEYQKIASFISSLDELITELTKKIEYLKMHKKGLMQGLFPNVNDANL